VKNRNINVILKNKIISVDLILPLCLELNKRCGFKFTFLVTELDSYLSIMNDNIVLRDIIESIGTIKNISNQRYSNKVISKIYFMGFLCLVSLRMITRKEYLFHFGALHMYPYKKIRSIFIKKRVIFSEATPHGAWNKDNYLNLRSDNISDILSSILSKKIDIYARIIVSYSPKWNYLKHPQTYGMDKIIFNNNRKSNEWINYFLNNSEKYIEKEFNRNCITNKPSNYFLIIDSRLNHSPILAIESFRILIRKLSPYSKETPVFIKAHVHSDLNYMKSVIEEESGDMKKNFIITKLHPVTFYKGAVASFFVHNSTVEYEMKEIGIPVIKCMFAFNNETAKQNDQFNECDDYVFIGGDKDEKFEELIDKMLSEKVDHNISPKKTSVDCSLFN
jgi:hypothetical protein